MAKAFRPNFPLLFVVILLTVVVSLEAGRNHGPSMVQKRVESQFILRQMGLDAAKLEYHRKRSMMDAETTRASPGGPDPQHHYELTALP